MFENSFVCHNLGVGGWAEARDAANTQDTLHNKKELSRPKCQQCLEVEKPWSKVREGEHLLFKKKKKKMN